MGRVNKPLLIALSVTAVFIGGRMAVIGTADTDSEEAQTRADLFSTGLETNSKTAYPTQEDIQDALGR